MQSKGGVPKRGPNAPVPRVQGASGPLGAESLTWSTGQVCDDGRAADPRRAARGTKRLEQPRRYGIVDAARHVFAHKPRRALAAAKGLVNQLTKLDARWPVVSEQHAPAGAKRGQRAMHDVRAIHALLCDELTRAFDDVHVKLGSTPQEKAASVDFAKQSCANRRAGIKGWAQPSLHAPANAAVGTPRGQPGRRQRARCQARALTRASGGRGTPSTRPKPRTASMRQGRGCM